MGSDREKTVLGKKDELYISKGAYIESEKSLTSAQKLNLKKIMKLRKLLKNIGFKVFKSMARLDGYH